MRPSLFIGSSKESLNVAYALQENLDDCAEVTVWIQGIFDLTQSTLQALLGALDRFRFAVFVFGDDDMVKMGGREYSTTRDNVIFEFGLFIGRLGPERTFFVVPKDQAELRIPTDLLGITPACYDNRRTDGNLKAALGPASNRIRSAIRSTFRPFSDELYERFVRIEARLRHLFIKEITSSDLPSEFPDENELSRLNLSELSRIVDLIDPGFYAVLVVKLALIRSALCEPATHPWQPPILERDMAKLEKELTELEQNN